MAGKPKSGELAQRPLPALLLDLHEQFANGRLTIRRGRMVKHFDLVNGNPMSAASTPRDETLGHFLVSTGVITDEQHQTAVDRAAATRDRLGETLVAMGTLTLEQLFEQLRRQARHKLVAALRWPQGAWTFDDQVEISGGMALRMTDVVLLGLKETAHEALDQLTDLEGATVELTARGQRMRPDLRRCFGDAIVEALGERAALPHIEAAVGDRMLARVAVDALRLCDAARYEVAIDEAPPPVAQPAAGGIALVDEDDFGPQPKTIAAPRPSGQAAERMRTEPLSAKSSIGVSAAAATIAAGGRAPQMNPPPQSSTPVSATLAAGKIPSITRGQAQAVVAHADDGRATTEVGMPTPRAPAPALQAIDAERSSAAARPAAVPSVVRAQPAANTSAAKSEASVRRTPSPAPAVSGRTPAPVPASSVGRTPTPAPVPASSVGRTPTPVPVPVPASSVGRTPTPAPVPASSVGRTPTPVPVGRTPTPVPRTFTPGGRTPTPARVQIPPAAGKPNVAAAAAPGSPAPAANASGIAAATAPAARAAAPATAKAALDVHRAVTTPAGTGHNVHRAATVAADAEVQRAALAAAEAAAAVHRATTVAAPANLRNATVAAHESPANRAATVPAPAESLAAAAALTAPRAQVSFGIRDVMELELDDSVQTRAAAPSYDAQAAALARGSATVVAKGTGAAPVRQAVAQPPREAVQSNRAAVQQALDQFAAPSNEAKGRHDDDLLENLFEGIVVPSNDGAIPLPVEELDESGVVSQVELATVQSQNTEALAARRRLVAEHVRIRGGDHYSVLLVDRHASASEISAALVDRRTMFSGDYYARYDLGLDRHKLDEVQAAYTAAQRALLDDRARKRYDAELEGHEQPIAGTTYEVELKFRKAEEAMAHGAWRKAVTLLEEIVAAIEDEATYWAALGWARWHANAEKAACTDAAREALNRALFANPDHARGHEYRGLIEAEIGEDLETAIFHLERAVELEPQRPAPGETLERLLLSRGELRRFERICKRAAFRLSGTGKPEALAWLRLARLYAMHLEEPSPAQASLARAELIAPDLPELLVAQKLVAAAAGQGAHLDAARAKLKANPQDTSASAAMVRTAALAGATDAAFVSAATVVALGQPDQASSALYSQYRRTAIVLPKAPLTAPQWAKLRHPDDAQELTALMDLLAPLVAKLAPLALVDVEVDSEMHIAEADLPRPFARLLKECAHLLGVAVPPVYARPDLGATVMIVGTSPPALVAGEDALTAPERPELVFRIARALTLASPGRAIGGTRPGRVLRAVVSAALFAATDTAAPAVEQAVDLAALSPAHQAQVRAHAQRFLARGSALNMSAWARALVRTADRVGLLLCGDPPTALAAVRESGEVHQDLIDFALSPLHIELRHQLGVGLR